MQSNVCKSLPQQPANVQQPTTSESAKVSPSMNDLKGRKNEISSMLSLNHRVSADDDNSNNSSKKAKDLLYHEFVDHPENGTQQQLSNPQ